MMRLISLMVFLIVNIALISFLSAQNTTSQSNQVQGNQAQGNQAEVLDPSKLTVDEIYQRYLAGKNAYFYGNYQDCIDKLKALLEPNILISEPEQRLESYRYLALSYFYLQKSDGASENFEKLLFIRPDYELDAVETPQNAINFFEQIKKSLKDKLLERQKILEEEIKKEEEKKKKANALQKEVDYQVNSRFVSILPFGIGQYQNDSPGLGTMFLTTELLSVGISMFAYLQVENLRQSDGTFSTDQFQNAQVYQNIQLISAYTALGLMLAGAVQALINFQEKKEIRSSERFVE
jgi:tetratricopeptide (TPR) repeat protein